MADKKTDERKINTTVDERTNAPNTSVPFDERTNAPAFDERTHAPFNDKTASVTNEDLVKMIHALQTENKALAAKVTANAPRKEGHVDFYHCNACGVRLQQGERCAQHPHESVHGVGQIYDQRTRTTRYDVVTES